MVQAFSPKANDVEEISIGAMLYGIVPIGIILFIPKLEVAMNPFKYGSTVAGDHFCPRPEAHSTITKHIQACQNIHIEGDRRTGKTSLVMQVCRDLKGVEPLHVDLMLVKSVDDFRARLLSGLSTVSLRAGLFDQLVKAIAHLRPTISVNSSTGEPTLALAAATDRSMDEKSLLELLDFARSKLTGKPPLVFFDEFQDVLKIPEAMPLLAQLRGAIQNHHDCAYIYSGSSRSEMDSIFRNPDSPFYKSALPVPIGTIARADFVPFLVDKFGQGNRMASENFVHAVLDMVADNPGDAQELCNCLWEISAAGTTFANQHLEQALELIFAREQKYFEQVIDSLSPIQKRCLHGLAAQPDPKVYSRQFTEQTGITNSGTITKAVSRLKKDRIIFAKENKLVFFSPFLRLWLMRHPDI